MKKFRIVLLSVAVVTAIGSAYAASRQVPCTSYPQYKKVGPSSYLFAGEYGYNYWCSMAAGHCTYYKPNPLVEVYNPCRVGFFEALVP